MRHYRQWRYSPRTQCKRYAPMAPAGIWRYAAINYTAVSLRTILAVRPLLLLLVLYWPRSANNGHGGLQRIALLMPTAMS